jgi:hypothetical protein
MMYVWYTLACLCIPVYGGEKQTPLSPQPQQLARTRALKKRISLSPTKLERQITVPPQSPLSAYFTQDYLTPKDNKHSDAQNKRATPLEFEDVLLDQLPSSSATMSSSRSDIVKNRMCAAFTSPSSSSQPQEREDEREPGSPRPSRTCSGLLDCFPSCSSPRKIPRPTASQNLPAIPEDTVNTEQLHAEEELR